MLQSTVTTISIAKTNTDIVTRNGILKENVKLMMMALGPDVGGQETSLFLEIGLLFHLWILLGDGEGQL